MSSRAWLWTVLDFCSPVINADIFKSRGDLFSVLTIFWLSSTGILIDLGLNSGVFSNFDGEIFTKFWVLKSCEKSEQVCCLWSSCLVEVFVFNSGMKAKMSWSSKENCLESFSEMLSLKVCFLFFGRKSAKNFTFFSRVRFLSTPRSQSSESGLAEAFLIALPTSDRA